MNKGKKYLANSEIRSNVDALSIPDRLFACVGKGIKSSLIEFRFGLEGKLGLEMDFENPIMQSWVLPQDSYGLEEDGGSIFLLSLGDHSAALLLASDASEVVVLDAASTRLDLRFRTITAATQERYTIQVTERSIVVIDGPQQ
jgi:Mono-functional DNA-alkylating methyl methanesulfonate N-term